MSSRPKGFQARAATASAVMDHDQGDSAATMFDKIRTFLLHYGGAVLAAALATGVRWLLDRWLANYLPLPTLYGAVALAVWKWGYRPAIVTTVLGYLGCAWLFVEPRGYFGLDSVRNLIGLGAYLLSCSAIIGCGEAMHRARRSLAWQQQLAQEVEQRKQSQLILDSFFKSSPYGIAFLDEHLRYMRVNQALADINGLSIEAHIGKSVAELVPDLAATAARVMQQVLKTGKTVHGEVFEGETPKAPGVRRFWEESWFALAGQDGRPAGAGVIVQEITDRKRDENALREATQQLRIITEGVSAPLSRVRRDLSYV